VIFDWAARRVQTKNPPCQSARRVSENFLGNSKSPLAVFYVEQVALNRHVFKCDCKTLTLAATPAPSFMLECRVKVKTNVFPVKRDAGSVGLARGAVRPWRAAPLWLGSGFASLWGRVFVEHRRHGPALLPQERSRQVLREKRIVVRAGDSLLCVLTVFFLRA
jgi:hypothetical protein